MIKLDLETFKKNVQDIARSNRFYVTFSGDAAVNAGFKDESMSYFVKSASLPALTIGEIEVNWFGQKYKVAGDITFDEYSITFLQDYDFKIKSAIEKWMKSVADHIKGSRGEHLNYKSTINIHQLGRSQNEILRTYKLVGAFPKQMNANELSMESTDSIQELEVTFSYDWWEVDENKSNTNIFNF